MAVAAAAGRSVGGQSLIGRPADPTPVRLRLRLRLSVSVAASSAVVMEDCWRWLMARLGRRVRTPAPWDLAPCSRLPAPAPDSWLPTGDWWLPLPRLPARDSACSVLRWSCDLVVLAVQCALHCAVMCESVSRINSNR